MTLVGTLATDMPVRAEIEFPDPSGTYEAYCAGVFATNNIFKCDSDQAEAEVPERVFQAESCPDTLVLRASRIVGGNGGSLQSEFSGEWQACNYYYPTHYVEPNCEPAPDDVTNLVDTATYSFQGVLDWTQFGVTFTGISEPAGLNLVVPSEAATMRSFQASFASNSSIPRTLSYGSTAPGNQVRVTLNPADWQDGTEYTVEEQFVNPANTNLSGGCTRSLFKAYNWRRTQFNWFQVSSATPGLPRANIEGTLSSVDPGTASTINRATIRLYSQRPGIIRETRLPGETEEEYRQFVRDNLAFVRTVSISTDPAGVIQPFGESGKFEFKGVPIYSSTGRLNGRPTYREQKYAIEIVDAASDIQVLDDNDQLVDAVAFFDDRIVTNLDLAAGPYNIELIPYLSPAFIKRQLAESLGGYCPAFATAEQAALSYLDQVDSGVVELTDERIEGIERAILAERAVSIMSRMAVDSLENALSAVATLYGDLISDIPLKTGQDISLRKEREDAIRAQREAAGSAWAGVSDADLKNFYPIDRTQEPPETGRNRRQHQRGTQRVQDTSQAETD